MSAGTEDRGPVESRRKERHSHRDITFPDEPVDVYEDLPSRRARTSLRGEIQEDEEIYDEEEMFDEDDVFDDDQIYDEDEDDQWF